MTTNDKPVPEAADEFEVKKEDPAPPSEAAQPGGEMFGDVVSDKTPRRKTLHSGVGADDAGQLSDSVKGLYEMVKDLEVQLNHMVSINEAAERDLEAARRSQRSLEKERGDLMRKIEKMELDAQSGADLKEELRHMTHENERVVEELRKATEDAARQKQQSTDSGSLIAQLHKEGADLREEIECLEAQLSQATQYMQALREDSAKIREARERETRKVELVEQRLHVVTEERDALKQELNESRSALEEIKRSIMDTNVQSQMTYYQT